MGAVPNQRPPYRHKLLSSQPANPALPLTTSLQEFWGLLWGKSYTSNPVNLKSLILNPEPLTLILPNPKPQTLNWGPARAPPRTDESRVRFRACRVWVPRLFKKGLGSLYYICLGFRIFGFRVGVLCESRKGWWVADFSSIFCGFWAVIWYKWGLCFGF